MFENQIRESVVAGSFYSSDPVILKKTIDKYIENAPFKNIDNIKKASLAELENIIGNNKANMVFKYFHDQNKKS